MKQKMRKIFFPENNKKIFQGFGPAFLVIAMGIGSGEFILWPYLSAHYGFGILWGAVLGISLQLIIIVAFERHTAFLGEDSLSSFSRVFKNAFYWIVFSTFIGFAWPGFSAMVSKLLIDGLNFHFSEILLSFFILFSASVILLIGKSSYKRIIFIQKINMSILLILSIFLFFYYFDFSPLRDLFLGIFGIGKNYLFIPKEISIITLMGAIAYAGSGGNLLMMNSFYVEKEKKGLVGKKKFDNEYIQPSDEEKSIFNIKKFMLASWKQNTLFFWFSGIIIIFLLSYISYAILHGELNLSEDFHFLIREAQIIGRDIHPLFSKIFIFSGAFALFGVQLGVFDFMGRVISNKPGIKDYSLQQKKNYKKAILTMFLFGSVILAFGITKPKTLIIIGSSINTFSMGILAFLLYKVEKKILKKYLQSKFFLVILPMISLFYISFFIFSIYKYINSF